MGRELIIFLTLAFDQADFAEASFAPVTLSTKPRRILSISPALCRSATAGLALLMDAGITGDEGNAVKHGHIQRLLNLLERRVLRTGLLAVMVYHQA